MLRSRLLIGGASLLLAASLVACGAPSEADIQAAIQETQTAVVADACSAAKLTAYATVAEDKIRGFEQQAQLVGSTPRVSLGAPLQRLLDIQTETRALEVPPCATEIQNALVEAMDVYQQAYQNFAAQGSDTTTTSLIETAGQGFDRAKKALAELKSGRVPTLGPFSTPTP